MARGDERRRLLLKDEHVWPALIIAALLVVVAMNAAFIWIAVSGEEDVAPSYVTGER